MNGQYPAIISDQSVYPAVTGAAMSCETNSYLLGNTVQVSVQFYDPNSSPIDPSVVSLEIKSPDSTTSSFVYPSTGMLKTGTGAYNYTYVPSEVGNYFYRWTGSGNLSSAAENQFLISDSNVLD